MKRYATLFPAIKSRVASLYGENISLSYPVPVCAGTLRMERSFLYPQISSPMRSRPFAAVTTAMDDGALLLYEDCRIRDFMPSPAPNVNERIDYQVPRAATKGAQEFLLEQGMINKMYELVRQIAFSDVLTDAQREVLSKYYSMLEGTVPAALFPYYNALGDDFFKWVKKNV